jgi:hypothetical protein
MILCYVMIFVAALFLPFSCYILPLRHKCPAQHPVLRHCPNALTWQPQLRACLLKQTRFMCECSKEQQTRPTPISRVALQMCTLFVWEFCMQWNYTSQVILRPTVSRPVYLTVRHPTRPATKFSFCSSLVLDSYWFSDVGRPLWREVGSVVFSFFSFLLGIASAGFLSSESHRTHVHILLILFLSLPPPGGPCSCIYFLQEQGSPVIPPGIG